MARSVLTLLALVFGVSASAQERIDLKEALARAQKKSPDYDILVQTENQGRLGYKNSWSELLPQLDLEARHGYARQGGNSFYATTPQTHPWQSALGITLTENLYDNGKSWNDMEIADLTRQSSSLGRERGRQQLMLTVAQAFYDYSSAVGNLELQKQQIDAIRQQFKTINGRYRNGVSSNRDFLRIKAQLERSEVDLANQEVTVEQSREALRVAIGESTAVDFIPFVPQTGLVDKLAFPKVQADQTADFRIAKMQDQISDIQYREVQREDWPRVSLQGSASYNDPAYIGGRTEFVDDSYWNYSAMLVIDYSLWDWGIRRRNVEIADNQRRVDKDKQQKSRIQIYQDLNRLDVLIAQYIKSYSKSRQIMKDEEAVYASLNLGYRDSKVTYLDLITGLNDLYASRTQNLSLQYNLLKARANLAFYQGNLDEILMAN